LLGEARARCDFHASHKGKNGPQLAVGILESRNTRLFGGLLPGNVPTGVEAFPALFCEDVTLPKAVDWLPVPSHVEIADTLGNAVTFLRLALAKQPTRYSVRKVLLTYSFRVAHKWKCSGQGLGPQSPSHMGSSTVACGGLKPNSSF
jgi:hypothetical protein